MQFFSDIILNRVYEVDPNSEVEALREGEYPHSSGILQVVDRPSLDSMVSFFKREKQQPNFIGLLIDRDHFSADPDKPSEAMGWVVDLRREGNSLMARVDWSATGEHAVRTGSYRLLSPVFRHEDLEDLGGGRKRPLRLDSIGLTNSPNMRGLRPISNRSAGGDDLTPAQIAKLSPSEAGERFNGICNRLRKEKGFNFTQAWNHLRNAEPLLFNRMAEQDRHPSRSLPGVAADEEFVKYASDAILAMAEQDRRSHGSSFTESWDRVRNRRPEVVRLTNRTTPQTEWADLETAAVSKFSERLDPDGRVLAVGNPEKCVKSFESAYYEMFRDHPGLTPRERLEKIKSQYPQVYWPFIAITAK